MASFYEFNIAQTGLFAAQTGLSVTSNNIVNAGTKGYSRQVLSQQATEPFAFSPVGMMGSGVMTTSIDRVRDSFLDQKLWNQNDVLGEYKVKNEQTALIESMFGEKVDSSQFGNAFDELFNSIDDFAKMPSETDRAIMVQQAMSNFATYYNRNATTLTEYQYDLNLEIESTVKKINSLLESVVSLNGEISKLEMNDGPIANELRDQRELALDELSQLVNIETEETEKVNEYGGIEKEFSVKINGKIAIDHDFITTLELEVREEPLNEGDAAGLYDINWSSGATFYINNNNLSGELKGLVDMRDGTGTNNYGASDYQGIPYIREQLDEFVRVFSENMNDLYNTDEAGGKLNPPQYLFSFKDQAGNPQDLGNPPDYSKITATNFSISKEILENPKNFRTNYEQTGSDKPNESKNDLLMDLLAQKDNKDMFEAGAPADYMISVFTQLGISAQEAQMHQSTQSKVTQAIENQRLSVSQVSLNEEFLNLTKYNQAYQASAKLMSVIDEVYETTINKLGAW
ncbi:flagellar hook-associated protein FlgK [Candidatus Epulonipiscium fishelsonii]|uniref:Flagellar hook-associated protein FlgK n=1 Tax=Candidatus Epulonipiscium fishelsonii TaxID=77094 RepID=A0ACC8XF71_9FIRM|nr:flagellar hook-associated protein FlgK [Epulopiscium sp. SCG-B05WGA-EpuloA1]ONI41953.1 flagellar hook-associated protein FlgK [Epulopiscium sp. SCG-B11WGA-EpuloA1]ONI46897.1 flagellar hook-associated protein FlgK [Epulopiscium sp. SCG-C06WGA-EpuloA1]